jgi:hypothetical protein
MSLFRSEHWQELCRQIATERDPHVVSQLVAQLLKELEAKKQSLSPENPPPAESLSRESGTQDA